MRTASLASILGILQSPVATLTRKADTFMERFSKRIEEMTADNEPAASALAVLILIARLESGLLKGEEGEEVPRLLWDASSDIRDAAVRFILADTFGGGKDDDEEGAAPRSEAKVQSDIEQLINIFEKYCPLVEKDQDEGTHNSTNKGKGGEQTTQRTRTHCSLHACVLSCAEPREPRSRALVDGAVLVGTSDLQRPMDMLVNGFWSSMSCLQDYSAVCSFVLGVAAPRASSKVAGSKKKAQPVDEDRQVRQTNSDALFPHYRLRMSADFVLFPFCLCC